MTPVQLFPKLPPSFPSRVNTRQLRQFTIYLALNFSPAYQRRANHTYYQHDRCERDTKTDKSKGRLISEGLNQLGHSLPIDDLSEKSNYGLQQVHKLIIDAAASPSRVLGFFGGGLARARG